MRLRLPYLLPVLLCLAGWADAPFIWRTPDGIVCEITADGLSRVTLGDRVVASGGLYAWDAGPVWFAMGEAGPLAFEGYSKRVYPQAAEAVTERALTVVDEHRARVVHHLPDTVVTWTYSCEGNDITVAARIENNAATRTLTVPAMGGLWFDFAKPPEGRLPVWHISYLQKVQLDAFHPSHLNGIGGSYATDGALGVGVTPEGTTLARTMIFWDYADWNPGGRETNPRRCLSYLQPDPIPPGGALTFRFTIRLTTSTGWQTLLQPYKRHYRAVAGERHYRVDDGRLVAVAHLNRSAESIGPDNPYGFHGGFRRIDLPEGAKAFCDLLVPALTAAHGQGVIIWGQGGQHPRGAMYRADFDLLPPEVEANWPAIEARFKAAGLKLGVTARPRHMPIPITYTTDGTIDINPDDPQHLRILADRFRHMIDRGCTMFYLDSFGTSYDDVRTMQYLREQLGPEIQTYAEHACDLMAAWSGFYTETDFWAKGSAPWADHDQYLPRTSPRFLEICRWLLDAEVPAISRLYDRHGEIPEGFEPFEQFAWRHHLTPMIADHLIQAQADGLARQQGEYLDADGHWRQPAAP